MMEKRKKWETIKNEVKWKLEDVRDWVRKNPIEATTVALAFMKGGSMIIRSRDKRRNLEEQRELKDRYIYDMSNRHYVKTRRALTNSEWLEFDRRRTMGEPVSWILSDMRLL